jgi:hypothetical protein
MGVVWCAHDDVLGEDVALKFLPDAVRWDPGAYDDLKAETRRARQLTHPNIVRIHDFAEDAGSAAISMELVNGSTLTALRLAKPNRVFEAAEIVMWLPQLCAALAYAHGDARVVHRDLKPTNVMLTAEGRLKVADFGVARSMADSISRVSMMSAGTLVYMSPQQAMGEEPSPADDIYALGATLYELLTGKPPFHTGDVRLQLYQRKPDAISARRRTLGVEGGVIPAGWEKVVTACLAKERDGRPSSVREVGAQLCAPEVFVSSLPPRPSGRSRARQRRWLLSAALFAAVAFATWRYLPRREASAPSAGGAFPSDATRALAAWNFDGDARDASGRGFDSVSGSAVPTMDRHGRIDRAFRFNGGADIVMGDAPALRWSGAEPFSASIWVRRTDGMEDTDVFWRSSGEGVGTLTWGLGFDRGRPCADIARLHSAEYGQNLRLTSDRVAPAETWLHLAVVSDGATATLFVDGVKAATAALGPSRSAAAPRQVELRFGRPERLSVWAFTGDLDEARIWRRALSSPEVAALSSKDAPPRFVLSKSSLSDNDDVAEALRNEFGAEARLADWDDLKRLHADDVKAWADELGFSVGATLGWIQRGGQRNHDERRKYFLNRFDGIKPAYYDAHDEMGGMTLALGSWHMVKVPLLAMLPPARSRARTLTADGEGVIRCEEAAAFRGPAMALTWKRVLATEDGAPVAVDLRLRDGRRLGAVCRPTGGNLAIALSDSGTPLRSRQVTTAKVELEFTLMMREGAMRFRAVTVVGGSLVFEERAALPGVSPADLVALELSGMNANAGSSQRGPASAQLIVE